MIKPLLKFMNSFAMINHDHEPAGYDKSSWLIMIMKPDEASSLLVFSLAMINPYNRAARCRAAGLLRCQGEQLTALGEHLTWLGTSSNSCDSMMG